MGAGPGCGAARRRFALDVGHDEEDETVRFADAMDRDDVRVGESGRHARLAQEPRARRPVAREVRRQDLDGDIAIQLHVPGEIDHPMPPRPSSRWSEYSPARPPAGRGTPRRAASLTRDA